MNNSLNNSIQFTSNPNQTRKNPHQVGLGFCFENSTQPTLFRHVDEINKLITIRPSGHVSRICFSYQQIVWSNRQIIYQKFVFYINKSIKNQAVKSFIKNFVLIRSSGHVSKICSTNQWLDYQATYQKFVVCELHRFLICVNNID